MVVEEINCGAYHEEEHVDDSEEKRAVSFLELDTRDCECTHIKQDVSDGFMGKSTCQDSVVLMSPDNRLVVITKD